MGGGRFRRRRPGEKILTVPVTQPTTRPGPEILPWYWHPHRDGAQPPPAEFDRQLKEIDPSLFVCFSPVHERWLIWMVSPSSVNSLCTGWKLLMLWETPSGAYLPLDELVFNNLYFIDRRRWQGAAKYYAHIEREAARALEARNATYEAERESRQAEFEQSFAISTAGRGNRAALHHSGTTVPSRGEQNWLHETRRWRLPSEMLTREREEKERRFYGK